MMLSQFNYSILLILFICSVSKVQSAISTTKNYENSKFLNNLKKEDEFKTELIPYEINKLPNDSNFISEKNQKLHIPNINSSGVTGQNLNSTVQLHQKIEEKVRSSSKLNKVNEFLENNIKERITVNQAENKMKIPIQVANISTSPGLQLKIVNKKLVHDSEDENKFLFYNSLSLIMLSMLAGGLVGVVFILYFTFRKDIQTEELN